MDHSSPLFQMLPANYIASHAQLPEATTLPVHWATTPPPLSFLSLSFKSKRPTPSHPTASALKKQTKHPNSPHHNKQKKNEKIRKYTHTIAYIRECIDHMRPVSVSTWHRSIRQRLQNKRNDPLVAVFGSSHFLLRFVANRRCHYWIRAERNQWGLPYNTECLYISFHLLRCCIALGFSFSFRQDSFAFMYSAGKGDRALTSTRKEFFSKGNQTT